MVVGCDVDPKLIEKLNLVKKRNEKINVDPFKCHYDGNYLPETSKPNRSLLVMFSVA